MELEKANRQAAYDRRRHPVAVILQKKEQEFQLATFQRPLLDVTERITPALPLRIFKMPIVLATLAIGAVLLPIAALAILSITSQNLDPLGIIDGKLAPCPGTPNCVCSESLGSTPPSARPFSFSGSPAHAMANVREAVIAAGGTVAMESKVYLAATFTSSFFKFVDDVEFRLSAEESVIHVRSASRTGHSDLGANGKRVALIRSKFDSSLPASK